MEFFWKVNDILWFEKQICDIFCFKSFFSLSNQLENQEYEYSEVQKQVNQLYIYIFKQFYFCYRAISRVSRVFTNGPGDRDSIPGQVIPKTQKMVLDATLLNTWHYKVRIKGKMEQSREWSSALPHRFV